MRTILRAVMVWPYVALVFWALRTLERYEAITKAKGLRRTEDRWQHGYKEQKARR